MDQADGRYGYRPWDRRPGDGVDPSVMLTPEQVIHEAGYLTPQPPMARPGPRLTGIERTQPGIVDVLGVGPETLMQDTPTRQDSGMQGTARPALGGI
jgi:hypothetical protein